MEAKMRTFLTMLMLVICATTCIARDLSAPEAKIPGAKVETRSDAKRLAFNSYIEKTKGNISATEAAREIEIIVLGYDVGTFAQRGTKLWEARITDNQMLRAIIWIAPQTEEVRFVCGYWDQEDDQKNSSEVDHHR
jgi:hypothetical protein